MTDLAPIILHGDCRELIAGVEAASVDLILADPPYGETSLEWDRWPEGWLDGLARVLAPTGSLWVFGSQRMFLERAADFKCWHFVQDVVWEKHNGSNPFTDRFRRVHEHAAQFTPHGLPWEAVYKNPLFTNDATARTVRRKRRPPQWGDIGASSYESHDGGPKLMRSVMFARSEHGRAIHPTQKPIACLLPLIEYSCPTNGLVLDPFAGSGSTLIAARQIGRRSLGIEANPVYVAAARARINADAPLLNAQVA